MVPPESFNNNTCHFLPSFGNMGVIETKKKLVIFDIALKQFGLKNYRNLRAITSKPIDSIIFSHGHFDHCFGFGPFIDEIKKKGWEMPEVIAHENCIKRFKKYQMLDKYHNWLNTQQFSSIMGKLNDPVSPHDFLNPTKILDGKKPYLFVVNDLEFELNHNKGETDDSLWLWVPEKELICSGDLMISSFPNVGNPYKVQRYPRQWAQAMEKMLAKEAKYIIPGHGKLIKGRSKVREVLEITGEVMNFVHDEVVKRLNEGKWFEEIYHEMLDIYPSKFKEHDYLRPLYGCYRFAIHAVYRLYHGWYYTGNPSDLFPSKRSSIAKELLKIAKPEEYFLHARSLFNQGKLQLALHIVDIIIEGLHKPTKLLVETYNLKLNILQKKIEQEPSFISSNILKNGSDQIKNNKKELKKYLKD